MLQPSTPFGARGPALSPHASPRFFLSFFPALKQKGAKKKRAREKKKKAPKNRPSKIQPATGDGNSSTRTVLPENEPTAGDGRSSTTKEQNPPFQYSSCTTRKRKSSRPPATSVSVLNLDYQRTKIQPAAGDVRLSTKLRLPENENPAGRRQRPFRY